MGNPRNVRDAPPFGPGANPPFLALYDSLFRGPTVAMGATAAVVTLASGPLYGYLGASAFWAMAAMCALAVPLTMGLGRTDGGVKQRS